MRVSVSNTDGRNGYVKSETFKGTFQKDKMCAEHKGLADGN